MPRIAIIGPGAIGGLAAAWLCQDPENDVTVCARTPFDHLRMETPWGAVEAGPAVLTRPSGAQRADWVLVAVKAYDSAAAAEWFGALVGDSTRVAILQNGVDHVERFSQWLPRERILPVIVDCPTERLAPGRIRQRGEGTLKVPECEAGEAFVRLFRKTRLRASTRSDFLSVAWRKLCLNAAGVVNALTLEPARIAHDEHAAAVMQNIAREAIAVGRAEGAEMDDGLAERVVQVYRDLPGDSVHSLHADRLAGRPMEIDLRNGVIVRLGRRHGIATPHNEMAVALLRIGTVT